MSPLVLLLAFALSGVAGVFFLGSYLWYRHAPRLYAGSVFPDDAAGVRLLRYGIATGFASFGGFLFVFVFHLLVLGAAGTDSGLTALLASLPLEETAVGLFVLSLATFCVAGAGYATDALRERFDGVR
jgi:O-antigen/teichoic acid export membrane protein